jgi:hypothetical protein
MVSGIVPTRWAFEGMLLLESDQRPTEANSAAEPATNQDLAESYFPADTLRMGVKADIMALIFMVFGLGASVAFIATAWKPRR